MKKISLLLLSLPFLLSCVPEALPKDCYDCQEAINLMAKDIESQSCDPEYLIDAWDLMLEECGPMTSTYIGFMAETCELGEFVTPECGVDRSLILDYAPFTYYTKTGLPEPVDITVQYNSGSDNFVFYDTDHNILTGPYDTLRPYPFTLFEGAEIEVTLYKARTDDELANASITFSFIRNKYTWAYPRQILINYTEDSVHTINFSGWGIND